MADPPASPSSSDVDGANRDRAKTVARGKPPMHDQQQVLAKRAREDVARPPEDPEISAEGNAQ